MEDIFVSLYIYATYYYIFIYKWVVKMYKWAFLHALCNWDVFLFIYVSLTMPLYEVNGLIPDVDKLRIAAMLTHYSKFDGNTITINFTSIKDKILQILDGGLSISVISSGQEGTIYLKEKKYDFDDQGMLDILYNEVHLCLTI